MPCCRHLHLSRRADGHVPYASWRLQGFRSMAAWILGGSWVVIRVPLRVPLKGSMGIL